jgi:hypothetical protein
VRSSTCDSNRPATKRGRPGAAGSLQAQGQASQTARAPGAHDKHLSAHDKHLTRQPTPSQSEMIGAIVGARRAAHRASYDNGARRRRREMERRALSRHQWACTLETTANRGRVQARRPWTSEDDQALSDAVAAEELAVQSALGDDVIGDVHIDWARVAHAVEQATGHRRTGAELHARHARLPPAPPQYVEQIPPGAADDFHHAQLPRAESRHSVPTAACEPIKRKKRGVLASMKAAHRFLFRRREKTKPRVVAVRCAN